MRQRTRCCARSITPFALEEPAGGADERAMARRVVTLFEEYVALHRRLPAEVVSLVQGTEAREKQAFAIAAHMLVRLDQRQDYLQSANIGALFSQLADTLTAEIEILRLERKIEGEVRGSLFQNQREFYLQEQLKAIHRELGQDEGDGFEELDRGAREEAASARRARARGSRDAQAAPHGADVPRVHGRAQLSRLDRRAAVDRAQRRRRRRRACAGRCSTRITSGSTDVKDRILDYIAVLALVGKLEGPILCLVGAPGVGKTSLGRSIARALGRTFVRMSLGGVRDEAEIRGHRRTYIGSLPGRVIQAMRRAEVVNPVILLDEVDKMGQDWRGDPSAALLEVLDPEQNTRVQRSLPRGRLRSLAGAVRHDGELARADPGAAARPHGDHPAAGLRRSREARDRAAVSRAAAARGARPRSEARDARRRCDPRGDAALHARGRRARARAPHRADRAQARAPSRRREAAWRPSRCTSALARPEGAARRPALRGGGADARGQGRRRDGARVHVGGRRSARDRGGRRARARTAAAHRHARRRAEGIGERRADATRARARAMLGIDPEFPKTRDIHVHLPAGATPKDGPSAGIAIAAALVSALTGVAVRGDTAMTGEVTLRGRVLPIGGLKEKLVAARRAGITHIIIPEGNAREIEEIPEDIREGLQFHPVSTMDEVLALALRARVRGARRRRSRRRSRIEDAADEDEAKASAMRGGAAASDDRSARHPRHRVPRRHGVADGWRPPDLTLPEVAFSGRSNVGKSSLLNALVRRKALARVSKTPGKTREINFFRVNHQFVLADLPGYGFARVAKTTREQWRPLIEGYLRISAPLRGVVQLIDSRHPPTAR